VYSSKEPSANLTKDFFSTGTFTVITRLFFFAGSAGLGAGVAGAEETAFTAGAASFLGIDPLLAHDISMATETMRITYDFTDYPLLEYGI
jgi:hypothetical protein